VREALIEVPIVRPEALVTEVIDTYGDAPPAQALPVSDDRYRGLLFLRDLAAAMFEHGPDATVADAMHDVPAVRVDVPAVEAARLMGDLDSAVIAVVDADGEAVGIVTALTMTGVLEYDPDE
jgi:CBS domain-containing protein